MVRLKTENSMVMVSIHTPIRFIMVTGKKVADQDIVSLILMMETNILDIITMIKEMG